MIVGTLKVRLLIREARSLKDKRQVVKSIKDKLHNHFNVSVVGSPKEAELTMHGLRHAAGFIQSKLASRLKTRFTPVIKFVLDEGVKKSIEMTRILNEEKAQSAPAPPEAGSTDGTAEEEPE